MKLSVSLPDQDVDFLDAYARSHGMRSRSAVLHQAVRALRDVELGAAYEASFNEWEASPEAALWEGTRGNAARKAPSSRR